METVFFNTYNDFNNTLFLLGRKDGELFRIGKVYYKETETYFHISGVLIEEQYRNAGFGHQLMNKIVELLGHKELQLTVSNVPSFLIPFYQSHGFVLTTTEEHRSLGYLNVMCRKAM